MVLRRFQDLPKEAPVFRKDFAPVSDASAFLVSDHCDLNITASVFKEASRQCLVVLERQLIVIDFLPGGIYGSTLPPDVKNKKLLDCCPLTNLTGERMFGDLDYDMTRLEIRFSNK